MRLNFLRVLLVSLLVSGCASDGSFASKAKPVDKLQTLKASCESVAKLDVAFQAFAKARPGVIGPNGMSIEGAVTATLQPLCVAPYPGDLDAAINTAISAAIQISVLLATWQTS